MSRPIPTIHGYRTPTPDEIAYMEYLDEQAELPGGHSFGLLLFKGDPVAFNLGFDEWKAEEKGRQERDRRNADRIDGYDRDDLGESPDY